MEQNALIVGVGKIGKVKSNIYKKYGFHVTGYDTKHVNIVGGTFDTFLTDNQITSMTKCFDVIDISVPTEFHLSVLDTVFKQFPNTLCLIEKPLVASGQEIQAIKELLARHNPQKLLYSENYVFSTALKFARNYIKKTKASITKIELEFSKDRTIDMNAGRFLDARLDGFGIEVPHMLAILEFLEVSPNKVISVETKNYSKSVNYSKVYSLIDIKLQAEGNREIRLVQSLNGKCILHNRVFIQPNATVPNSTYRIAEIHLSNGDSLYIQFEPISDIDRYISKMTIVDSNGKLKFKRDFDDNTLDHLISNIKNSDVNDFLDINAAIRINTLIVLLNGLAKSELDLISHTNKHDCNLLTR